MTVVGVLDDALTLCAELLAHAPEDKWSGYKNRQQAVERARLALDVEGAGEFVADLARADRLLREALATAEQATALAELYGKAIVAIGCALPNEIGVRAIIASLDTGAPE